MFPNQGNIPFFMIDGKEAETHMQRITLTNRGVSYLTNHPHLKQHILILTHTLEGN